MDICGRSKNTRISNRGSTSTHLVSFLSRYSISATYDHKRHSQEPETSIIIPNTVITFRCCCKWVFGVPQKILKQLINGLHQQSLFYLCLGIVIQPHMTTRATHRNIRQAQLSLSDSAASGVLKKTVNYLIKGLC